MLKEINKTQFLQFTNDTEHPSSTSFQTFTHEKIIQEQAIQGFFNPESSRGPSHNQNFVNPLYINRPTIREKYLFKVLGSETEQSQPALKNQNSNFGGNVVFIFDWDDTLLCTSYLNERKFLEVNEQCRKMIKEIDQIVFTSLNRALEKGIIFIITNSVKGWVNYSSKIYMQKTHSLLIASEKIKIWSARDLFGDKFPGEVKRWKIEAFKKILRYVHVNMLTNMICIGDSEDQMEASQVVAKYFKRIYLKKIKLQELPTPEQLLKQLKLFEKKFQEVFQSVSTTTIKLAKKMLVGPESTKHRNTVANINIRQSQKH